MMCKKALTDLEIATLLALFHATNGSIHAHVPKQVVQAHFRKDLRGFVSKELKRLMRKRYAVKHPTGRQTTYGVTEMGIEKLREMNLI